MAKVAAANDKPSIRFCPVKRQHEAGIDYVTVAGVKTKITHMGFVAPTMEDERRILRAMEADRFCGITTWENREMPAEQKAAEADVRKANAATDAALSELNALKEEIRQLKAGQKG